MFDYFANPSRFMRIANWLLLPLVILSVITGIIGLYLGLFVAPADYQQGDTVRIIYIHVPSAWLALFGYVGLGLCGLFYVVWRHPLADIAARAIAPVGAVFAFLTLVTGALWGKPMWGAWWVWDARLTSMLILFFFYLGFIALANGFDRAERGSRPAALLALVGMINVPIVKFSVDWWNTLHQPASLLRSGGPAIDSSMLTPLVLMLIAAHAYFAILVILRMRALLTERRLAALRTDIAASDARVAALGGQAAGEERRRDGQAGQAEREDELGFRHELEFDEQVTPERQARQPADHQPPARPPRGRH